MRPNDQCDKDALTFAQAAYAAPMVGEIELPLVRMPSEHMKYAYLSTAAVESRKEVASVMKLATSESDPLAPNSVSQTLLTPFC